MKGGIAFFSDLRDRARLSLPQMVFDYIDGGAGDESGVERDSDALRSVSFLPRRLVDVSHRSTSVNVFNTSWKMPIAVAPMGLSGVVHPNADIILARAAAKAGIPYILSTASTSSIEDVARSVDGDCWFQLYVLDRDIAASLVRRARASRYSALVLTVDVPLGGMRHRDVRNGFSVPFRVRPSAVIDAIAHPGWLAKQIRYGFPELANMKDGSPGDVDRQATLLRRSMDASFSWEDLNRLRDTWDGRLIVKGLLHPDDVHRAEEAGADAVIVSTHGGRQLDSMIPALQAFRTIRASSSLPLMFDSGIRSGGDVLKLRAMGAQMVLIGRPLLYALAAGGASLVEQVLSSYQTEMDNTLAQLGCADVTSLSAGHLQITGSTDEHDPVVHVGDGGTHRNQE